MRFDYICKHAIYDTLAPLPDAPETPALTHRKASLLHPRFSACRSCVTSREILSGLWKNREAEAILHPTQFIDKVKCYILGKYYKMCMLHGPI